MPKLTEICRQFFEFTAITNSVLLSPLCRMPKGFKSTESMTFFKRWSLRVKTVKKLLGRSEFVPKQNLTASVKQYAKHHA